MAPKVEFKSLVDPSELEATPRDLRFHPVKNDHPVSLTRDQIDQYNRDGYIKGLRVYSPESILKVRQYFDQLLASVIAAGGDSYSISTAHLKYGPVWDILTHPPIVRYVHDLLGPNVVGWGSHFFCKMPGDGKGVAWHQDASYWPLSPSKALTVWLAIDDASPENGCMRFVAGSHHSGHVTFRQSSPEEHNVLNQTIEDPEQFGTFVDDELQAGEMSIHSDLLLHGSEPNNSNRRRCGLTLRYASAEVRAGLQWNEKGVWVAGSDSTGHWLNRPRPDAEF